MIITSTPSFPKLKICLVRMYCSISGCKVFHFEKQLLLYILDLKMLFTVICVIVMTALKIKKFKESLP